MKTNQRGVSSLEFAFGTLVLVPLTLGMIRDRRKHDPNPADGPSWRAMRVTCTRAASISLCRGIRPILANIGNNLGMTTASSSSAVVILSNLTYVDKNMCGRGQCGGLARRADQRLYQLHEVGIYPSAW